MLENIKSALQAIMINKVRAFLTMLGVIIGVFSVVTLSAIGNGVTIYINDQFETLGSNNLYVEPGKFDSSGDGGAGMASVATLPNGLPRSLEKEILSFKQYVSYLSPYHSTAVTLTFRHEKKMAIASGMNEHGLEMVGMNIAQGRGFTAADIRGQKNVVILGSEIAEELFDNISPVGKKIKINERTFQVIGITEKKGSGGGMMAQLDQMVSLPIEHVFNFTGADNVDEYAVKVKNKDLVPEAKEVIQTHLRTLVKDEQVSVIDQAQITGIVDQIMGVLTAGLSGIAAISLLVGGIGIMNIMLVSVTERTREIGLRKALGATPNTILSQFLFEALFLSVTGGMLGVLAAYLTTLALQQFFPATVSLGSIILAFSVSLIVGLIFGVMPARRAAKLSPIEALRYE
jgi:putative ABC transport system permease protein